jgi:GT2 family glycosyltransferase
LLAVTPKDMDEAIETIQSIVDLSSQQWQLVIFVPDETIRADVANRIGGDRRIVFNIGEPLDLSSCVGDYIVFCQAGDVLFPWFLASFSAYYKKFPQFDLYYFDCEYFRKGAKKPAPLMKPERISLDFLLSVNFLSRGLIRKEFLLSKKFNRISNDLGQVEYAIALAAAQTPDTVRHIPNVLIQQKQLMQPNQPELSEIVAQHLTSIGLQDVRVDSKHNQPHFSWATQKQHVAIIIPTKNHHHLLKTLLPSIESSAYKDFSVFIVDNQSSDPETLRLYDQISHRKDVTIIPFNEPFNYSRAINLGVTHSDSDILLFLNDDMKVIHPEWLGEMVQWAQRPEIGVVGTKLIRRNRSIQHAGIVVGLNAFVGHIFLNAPENYDGLFGSVNWVRNYLALTGACQMVRRSVFNEVHGYDKAFKLAFGDIDFCLKVQEAGYRNVYTPFAALYHLEGRSRGYATPLSDIEKGYQKLERYLFEPDPYYSQNLSLTVIPEYIQEAISLEERKNRVEQRHRFYLK